MDDIGYVIKLLAGQRYYLYITRDIRVFEAQEARLNKLKFGIESTKNMFIAELNEEKANLWLAAENLCTGIIHCIQMFLDLKRNKPDSAWNRLVEAQNHASWSCDKNDHLNSLPYEYTTYFEDLEKNLFPPQQFNSISFLAKTKCSICNSPMSECDHIRGNAYMGRHCIEIITEFIPLHVAIVDRPGDKKCRDTHYGTSKDKMINIMTLVEDPADRSAGREMQRAGSICCMYPQSAAASPVGAPPLLPGQRAQQE